jgi:uroporphyrinogen decarboxylase
MAGGAAMEAETQEILDKLSDGPFIFNLGHGVLQWTSPDHVGALINHIRAKR